jgi:hypothetical protein
MNWSEKKRRRKKRVHELSINFSDHLIGFLGVRDMISENKMFLSIFFGLVWLGEREKRERDLLWSSLVWLREREERERGTEWFREFRELQQHQHTHTCTHSFKAVICKGM